MNGTRSKPRLLVFGTKGDDPNLLRRATQLGIDVTLIQQPKLFVPVQLEHAREVLLFDYNERERLLGLVRALHADAPFVNVLCLTEPAIIAAAQANDALGLGSAPAETVRLLQDKAAMRELLNAHGLSRVRSMRGSGEAPLRAFLAATGGPIVVKPVDGGASVGVTKVCDAAEIPAALERVRTTFGGDYIAEEFLDGPELSVEAFSFGGRHVVIAVTDKLTGDNFVEIGHAVPSTLPDRAQAEIRALVTAFLDLVGLRDGASHTEIILTARGPRIVESHNRIGGDRINELVEAVYGVDMATMAFAWACGLMEPLPEPPAARLGAAVRFIVPPPGVVREVGGTDAVASMDDVITFECKVAAGQTVGATESNLARSGHVAVRAADVRSALARCETYLATLRFGY